MTLNFHYNYPQVARDAGFKLRHYKDGMLDWRLLGNMEVQRLLHDQTFEQIDEALQHLAEVPLGSILDTNILDSGISKYFILSQFSIQYLLFCRSFLEDSIDDLRELHASAQMEIANLKRSLSEANNEILQLNKKITQMEAIHEVIYPCHFCTKNFINNDALNLHILRKHQGGAIADFGHDKHINQTTIDTRSHKNRQNDLTLINTIKLELEIKQLKERLNTAEREIKERTIKKNQQSLLPNTDASIIEKSLSKNTIVTKIDIGIQNNMEVTQIFQNNEGENINVLLQLEEQIKNFENWKSTQHQQNETFFSAINNKLENLLFNIEKNLNKNEELEISVSKRNDDTSQLPINLTEIENVLTKKIGDIYQLNSDRLDIIQQVQIQCQNQLTNLEKGLYDKINEYQFVKINSQNDLLLRKQESLPYVNLEYDKMTKNEITNPHNFTIQTSNTKLTQSDENLSTESNKTFTKSQTELNDEGQLNDDKDTDISDSLLNDEEEEEDSVKSSNESLKDRNKPIMIRKIGFYNIENQEKHLQWQKSEPKLSKPQKKTVSPNSIITRAAICKLTNARLKSFGVNMKTTAISHTCMKRILKELNENRILTQKDNSQFTLTRIKFKKFVDKLCSAKLSPSSQTLLKQIDIVTKPYESESFRDTKKTKHEINCNDAKSPKNPRIPKTITETAYHNDFKQRLERILASPIRKPSDYHCMQIQTKAVVHDIAAECEQIKPVPLPRKKVMFDQEDLR